MLPFPRSCPLRTIPWPFSSKKTFPSFHFCVNDFRSLFFSPVSPSPTSTVSSHQPSPITTSESLTSKENFHLYQINSSSNSHVPADTPSSSHVETSKQFQSAPQIHPLACAAARAHSLLTSPGGQEPPITLSASLPGSRLHMVQLGSTIHDVF